MISSLEIRNDQNQMHLKEGQLEEAKKLGTNYRRNAFQLEHMRIHSSCLGLGLKFNPKF